MIRVPLRDLRVAFSDPSRYVGTFRPGKRGGGPSKYNMLLFAVGEFHHTNNLKQAQDYLEKKIVANFPNAADLPQYVQQLQSYTREFAKLGNAFVRVKDNISIPIPKAFEGIAVSGQAARIDLVASGGYAVWIFGRGIVDWELDPRLPLIQLAYSQRLGVNLNEVSAGVYDFKTSNHSSKSFTQSQVDQVNKSLRKLLTLIQQKF
jgi:hypothetical protein